MGRRLSQVDAASGMPTCPISWNSRPQRSLNQVMKVVWFGSIGLVLALGVVALIRGGWDALLSMALTIGLPLAISRAWLGLMRRRADRLSERLAPGAGSIPVLLAYWSVPSPWVGHRLLPLGSRSAPGLPMELSIEGGRLTLAKRRSLSTGRRAFVIEVWLGDIAAVDTGPASVGIGGRGVLLTLHGDQPVLFDVIAASPSIADRVVAAIDSARAGVRAEHRGLKVETDIAA